MKKIYLVAISLLMSGCASQVGNIVGELNDESVCCKSFHDFDYDTLALEKDNTVTIGSGDKVYSFKTGKSYFRAFTLPKDSESHSLEIRTYLMGEWIPTAHVFGPYILFLNSDKEILDREVFPKLFYDEGFFEGARWTGVINIPKGADFLVVYTKPELLNKRIALASTDGYGYYAGSTYVYVPPSGARSSSFGPAGKIRIKFLPTIK